MSLAEHKEFVVVEHASGIPWFKAPPPRRFHRHRAWTRTVDNGELIERCACGAFGPAPWFMLWPDKPRRRPSLLSRLSR